MDTVFNPEKLLHLLTSMPQTNDIIEWIEQFKKALHHLLDDVDHVSLIINGLSCFSTEEQTWLRFFAIEGPFDMTWPEYVSAFTPQGAGVIMPNELSNYEYDDEPQLGCMSLPSSIIYSRLKRDVPQVSHHHEPLAFDYHTEKGKFLGVIFLWRSLNRPPVSERATMMLKQLRPFIIFAMESAIAREELKRPLFRGLFVGMARLVETVGLSGHEARVVGYLLLGLPYKQIADRMKISVDTVRKYIKSVYRKAGVHSLNELYARHFLPWPN